MANFKRFHYMHAHYTDEWSDDKRHRIQEFFSYNTKIASLNTFNINGTYFYILDIGKYFNYSNSTSKQFNRWLYEVVDLDISYIDIKKAYENGCKNGDKVYTFYPELNTKINIECCGNIKDSNGYRTFSIDYYRDVFNDFGRY